MAAPESRCLVPIWLFDPRITPDCIMPSARAAANWKTDSPRTHYWSMSESSGHRSCKCGAVYDRSEHMVADREISSFECAVCGKTIENWNSSSISIHCQSSSGCRITGRPKRPKGHPQPARQPEAALRSINNVRARLEPSHRRRIFAEWTKFFHQS